MMAKNIQRAKELPDLTKVTHRGTWRERRAKAAIAPSAKGWRKVYAATSRSGNSKREEQARKRAGFRRGREVAHVQRSVGTARAVRGTIAVSPTKSISHRAAILNGIAEGEAVVEEFQRGADCIATLRCLRQLGVSLGAGETSSACCQAGPGVHALREPAGRSGLPQLRHDACDCWRDSSQPNHSSLSSAAMRRSDHDRWAVLSSPCDR